VVDWDPAWSARPFADLLARLRGDPGAGPAGLPAILVDPEGLPVEPTSASLVWATGEVRPDASGDPVLERRVDLAVSLRVVGVASSFPGAPRSTRQLLVVPADGLAATGAAARLPLTAQVWARGEPGAVVAAMTAAGVAPAAPARSAAELAATPAFASVDWTFGLLQGLGLLAVAVSLSALLLYASSRQAARTVTDALVRRMGLAPRAHRTATALELTALLGIAYLIGASVAVAAAALVVPRLDPLPGQVPGLRLWLPLGRIGLVGAALPIVAWLAAALLQRRAGRADVAEVMRLAG
jgi:hypothetical protein